MMRTDVFGAIFLMAAATFFTRFAGPALLAARPLPAWTGRVLKHVPTAMFTALIVPTLVAPQGQIALQWENHYLVAGLAAGAAACVPLLQMALALHAGMSTFEQAGISGAL